MNNHKGFTLIELLIYIGVSTLFLLALSGFVFSIFATYRQSNVKSEQQRELANISARLQHEIESAYAIDPSSTFNLDLGDNAASSVTLHTRTASDDPLIFSVSEDELLLQKGVNPPQPLHSSTIRIPSCVFTNQSAGGSTHIGITFTISTPVGFGIPDAQTKTTLTIELKDYAP